MQKEVMFNTAAEQQYPVLVIPKTCISWETSSNITNDMLLILTITYKNNENILTMYSGYCNIKVPVDDSNSLEGQLDVLDELSRADLFFGSNNCDVKESHGRLTNRERQENQDANYDSDEMGRAFLYEICDLIGEESPKVVQNTVYEQEQKENGALKQMTLTDIPGSNQQNTILYLGNNSQCGVSVNNIAEKNKLMQCFNKDTIMREENPGVASFCKKRKYQCDASYPFKKPTIRETDYESSVKYTCNTCATSFKCAMKYHQHCQGHGNPDLECPKCHKVFVSNYTLRIHSKIHNRQHHCLYCTRSYDSQNGLENHMSRFHTKRHAVRRTTEHMVSRQINNDSSKLFIDIIAESEAKSVRNMMLKKLFLKDGRKNQRNQKICDECKKVFCRLRDLKLHLIEHIIKDPLAKDPVDKNGTVDIPCAVCHTVSFTNIDKYKAHLCEHAKVTLYQCLFCTKSFRNSRSFSKHKRTHGKMIFQCDICLRNFNSKKSIASHMIHHNKKPPVNCTYCGEKFFFESILKKHVKSMHSKEIPRARSRLGQKRLKSLNGMEKWNTYNLRKSIVDCIVCDAKFRMFSELERHYQEVHNFPIPPTEVIVEFSDVAL